MHAEPHFHFRLQIGGLIPDHLRRNRDLIVIVGVHEVEAVGVIIEELVLPILHMGALDLLGGFPALRHLHAVGNSAHIDLGYRRAFAGMDAFHGQDDIELAVHVHDIAFAKRASDDSHG